MNATSHNQQTLTSHHSVGARFSAPRSKLTGQPLCIAAATKTYCSGLPVWVRERLGFPRTQRARFPVEPKLPHAPAAAPPDEIRHKPPPQKKQQRKTGATLQHNACSRAWLSGLRLLVGKFCKNVTIQQIKEVFGATCCRREEGLGMPDFSIPTA